MANFFSHLFRPISNLYNRESQYIFGRGDRAIVPGDMRGLRDQGIDLLHQFLMPGAFAQGGFGNQFFFGGADPNASTPETDVYNHARPLLESMLNGGTGPQFERDIAAANSSGDRFSSGNAILRGEALRNLYNSRTQTAQTLGGLAHGAGQSQFDHQSQLLQLLAGLFGQAGQATFSLPVQNDRGIFDSLLKAGVSYAVGKGGGGGSG